MIDTTALLAEFSRRYNNEPTIIARAPGRINLIGEHTDYNGGFVLPAAINYEIKIAARPAPSNQWRLWSVNCSDSFQFPASAPLPPQSQTTWRSYFLAVLDQFQQRGHQAPPHDIIIQGDVPLGAGLSSSAAYEVCAATLLNHITGASLTPNEIALLAQAAEHSHWVGVRCGIMDQFASALGLENSALKLDCHTLDYEAVPFNSDEAIIVIINTNKPRELRTSDYNRRRLECEEGLRLINELAAANWPTLRHIPLETYQFLAPQLPGAISRRVRHNITENHRVLNFAKALHQNNWDQAGQLLYQSHESLRDDFEVSCRELDTIVEIARQSSLAYGCRMTGGGFGGCAIALLPPDNVAPFKEILIPAYKNKTGLQPEIYTTPPASGARIES